MRPRENKHHVLFTKYGQARSFPKVLRSSRRLPSMPLPMNEYYTVGSGMEGSGC